MKKIAILGCENSHADAFLGFIKDCKEFSSVEVEGIYSEDREACEKLKKEYGVPVLENYADAVGKVDGLIITSRHGGLHYKYAKPYLSSGIPMLIDKPIAINEEELEEFIRDLKTNGVRITGGSSLRHDELIRELKAEQEQAVGGVARAPVSMSNPYGDFFFYSQHMVEMVCEVFGRYPYAVQTFDAPSRNRTVVFRYENFDATGLFVENSNQYYALRFTEKETKGGNIPVSRAMDWYYGEFKEFYDLLYGGHQVMSYRDFAAPVNILNAIQRSSKTGQEEPVTYINIEE